MQVMKLSKPPSDRAATEARKEKAPPKRGFPAGLSLERFPEKRVVRDSQAMGSVIRFLDRMLEGSMGKPYSLDLRERVVAALEGGLSTDQAAKRFSIGKATAGAWGRLKRSQGDVRPAKQGKPKGSVLDAHADFILGTLRQTPDLTLAEMVERLAAERDVRVVGTAVWKFLDRHGQTHKKRLRMPASRTVPT
jgi:transposase